MGHLKNSAMAVQRQHQIPAHSAPFESRSQDGSLRCFDLRRSDSRRVSTASYGARPRGNTGQAVTCARGTKLLVHDGAKRIPSRAEEPRDFHDSRRLIKRIRTDRERERGGERERRRDAHAITRVQRPHRLYLKRINGALYVERSSAERDVPRYIPSPSSSGIVFFGGSIIGRASLSPATRPRDN